MLGRPDRAVEIGLSYLKRVGITWPLHPTGEDVREEYERLWRQLDSRQIESLFDLPLMSDPEIRATIEVLSELQGPTYWTDLNLEHLVLLRIANVSIRHGNSDASALAYGLLNAVVGARFGHYAEGYRFGLLGIDLVEKKGLDRARPRVYRNLGAWVVPWMRHLREAHSPIRRALEWAEEWRPLPYYFIWMYSSLVTHGLAAGDPLADVQREAEEGRRRVTQEARTSVVARCHDRPTRLDPNVERPDTGVRVLRQ